MVGFEHPHGLPLISNKRDQPPRASGTGDHSQAIFEMAKIGGQAILASRTKHLHMSQQWVAESTCNRAERLKSFVRHPVMQIMFHNLVRQGYLAKMGRFKLEGLKDWTSLEDFYPKL